MMRKLGQTGTGTKTTKNFGQDAIFSKTNTNTNKYKYKLARTKTANSFGQDAIFSKTAFKE